MSEMVERIADIDSRRPQGHCGIDLTIDIENRRFPMQHYDLMWRLLANGYGIGLSQDSNGNAYWVATGAPKEFGLHFTADLDLVSLVDDPGKFMIEEGRAYDEGHRQAFRKKAK